MLSAGNAGAVDGIHNDAGAPERSVRNGLLDTAVPEVIDE